MLLQLNQIYLFAKEFGDDKEFTLQNKILCSGNYKLIVKYARFVKGANKDLLLNRAKEIKSLKKAKSVNDILSEIEEERE